MLNRCSLFGSNPVKKINTIFFSNEPQWYWGFFCFLSSIIIIIHAFNIEIFDIHKRLYTPLPLFKVFHIPSPSSMALLFKNTLSIFVSEYIVCMFLKVALIGSLTLSVLMSSFQRAYIFVSFIGFFVLQGWFYGYIRTEDDPFVYHSANIAFFVLLIRLISPFNRWTIMCWFKEFNRSFKINFLEQNSVNYPVWPRLLIIMTIGFTYFGSSYVKYVTSGVQWMNGYTLQRYLLDTAYVSPFSYGYWLSQQHFYIIRALNIGVWAFQFFALGGLLWKKTRLIYGILGIVFHLNVFLFLGISFSPFQYFYIVFIPEAVVFLKKCLKKNSEHIRNLSFSKNK